MDAFPIPRRARLALAAAVCACAVVTPAPALAAPDPLLPEQWALGEEGGLSIRDAWTQSTGGGVLVAILDTGVQLDHPELRANLWANPDEVAGNGADDDANGVVDDVHGANLLAGGADVADDHGHGTHVAGIVAARAGNGEGGSGVAPAARIMPVKVLDAQMSGTSEALAAGIRYAVAEGARILNISINSEGRTSDVQAAVGYAREHGATVVASAGNDGRDIDLLPSFPAALPDPAILSITATEPFGGLWGQANRGLGSVDLGAPGARVLSTGRGSGYELRSGTSMAAPHVAGALALLAAARPDLGQPELREALLATADRRAGLSGLLAAGHLDIGAAMRRVRPGAAWRTASAAAAGPRLRLRAGRVRAGRRATLRWSAVGAGADAVTRWRVSLDTRVVRTVRRGGARVVRRRVGRAGRHRWRVVGFDAAGEKVVAATRAFRALRRR